MLEVILRMLIVLLIVVLMALPFQLKGSPEYYVSLLSICVNGLGILMIWRRMKVEQNQQKV